MKHPPRIKANFFQAALLLGIIIALSCLFYLIPSKNSGASSAVSSGNVSNVNFENGIGGGNIIGSCTAGKKDLPIYCVDVSSKQKQENNAQNLSDSASSQESGSASDSNSNTNANSGTAANSGAVSGAEADSGAKYISVSFDAAWGADDTLKILDTLDKYNVKATFFMTGGWVDSFPDMVKEIYARGHDLGNHSQNHKQMSKLSANEQKTEIMTVSDKIRELTGYEVFLFRPPYGDYNSTLINTVYSCNHYPIQWDVDSLDWKDYGVENIIKTVTQHKALGNGSIILMHNGAKYTAEALDTVLSTLQSQGYTLVPISQLIIKQNFHMDATGRQIAD